MTQATPLATGTMDLPPFNRDRSLRHCGLIRPGRAPSPSSWRLRGAGVVRYDVDFTARTVAYYGCNGEEYVEAYPAVEVDQR